MPTPPATLLSRRRLLAASGATLAAGSAAALAACGSAADDEESPEESAESLNLILAAQLALKEAIGPATEAQEKSSLVPALEALAEETDSAIKDLESAIKAAGGTTTTEADPPASEAESAVEGLRDQLDAAILAATGAVANVTDTKAVATVYEITFTDAANVSLLNDVLGEDPAPDAFVGVPGAGEGQ